MSTAPPAGSTATTEAVPNDSGLCDVVTTLHAGDTDTTLVVDVVEFASGGTADHAAYPLPAGGTATHMTPVPMSGATYVVTVTDGDAVLAGYPTTLDVFCGPGGTPDPPIPVTPIATSTPTATATQAPAPAPSPSATHTHEVVAAPASPPPADTLPRTGPADTGLAAVGLALVLLGTALVSAARRCAR